MTNNSSARHARKSALTSFVDVLRRGEWLIEERVAFYSAMTIFAYLLFAAGTLWTSPEVVENRSYARDFSSAWVAGMLARDGRAPEAYDRRVLKAEEMKVLPGMTGEYYWAWFYPPVALLWAVLLALPYGWAQLSWLGGTAIAYAAAIRRIWPHPRAVLVALAWPGFIVNLIYGQNGFFSAALLAAGCALIESRPLAAGVLLGALCYKPQIALLVPLALLAGQHRRVLLTMAATIAVLCAAVVVAFGMETWLVFFGAAADTRLALETGAPSFFHIITMFSSVRQLGGPVPLAYALQGVTTLLAAWAVFCAWRSHAPLHMKAAVLAAAVPLATPFALAYDLVIDAIAVAGLGREGVRTGFRPWERTMIALVCITPAASPMLADHSGISLAPLVQIGLLVTLMRRIFDSPDEPAPAANG